MPPAGARATGSSLSSTDFDPYQAEERTVTAISGNALTLDKPLKYMHFGEITYGVDERGEVGLLTRNIKIQASDDAEKTYFGGHIMAMAGSKMYVSGVELNRMGQNMHLRPLSDPLAHRRRGPGAIYPDSSIHNTYSRCVTVHGTNNVRVENNVTFNTVGHCFFLEDAVETGNQFIHNLGILTKCHPDGKPCVPTNLGPAGSVATSAPGVSGQNAKDVLIPSDNTASMFWIHNPDNIYRDNVSAGSEEVGFWFALPEHPTGAFLDKDGSKTIWPRRTKVREFSGNTAHSNYDGFMFDRGPQPRWQVQRRRQQLPPGLRHADRRQEPAGRIGLRQFHQLQEPAWRCLGPRRTAPVPEPARGRQRRRLHPCGVRGGAHAYTSKVVDGISSWAKAPISAIPARRRKSPMAAACRTTSRTSRSAAMNITTCATTS